MTAVAHLDSHFAFQRSMSETTDLDALADVLSAFAPRWSSGLHVYRGRGQPTSPVDLSLPGSLRMAAVERAFEHGQLYTALAARSGEAAAPRGGWVELRGANRSLTVVIRVDRSVYLRVAEELRWANSVAFQVRGRTIEGRDFDAWLNETTRAMIERLDPAVASAHATAEFDAKNMVRDNGVVMAIGMDIGRWIPGPYWMTAFGTPYVEFLGRDNLLTALAQQVSAVGRSICLHLSKRPDEWDAPKYRTVERAVRNHLGSGLFFDRDDVPSRTTRLPFMPSGPE